MRILVAHNYYQQPGGEDKVFESECELLETRGHHVVRYILHNDRLKELSALGTAARTIWNRAAYRELRSLIRRVRPELCHFHNIFPLMSPAAYHAARAERTPVVVTMHNYRLACPGATLLRNGIPCEDCVGKAVAWPGILHGCYRDSHVASAGVAAISALHRLRGTWGIAERYIALTGFARQKLIDGGLPAHKITVKPNFISADPGVSSVRQPNALFVGRLGPEKGIPTLIDAWRVLGKRLPLKILGDGPLAPLVAQAARDGIGIEWVGSVDRTQVINEMQQAQLLVLPSICYEGLPLTLVEAFSTGLPVIASSLGSLPELVDHGRTGLLFRAGDPQSLIEAINLALDNPATLAVMRIEARRKYEDRYTADKNYAALLEIYKSVLESRR